MSEHLIDARYQQALAFLLDRIDYERGPAVPYHAKQYKLDRMRELLRRLGSPQAGLKIVHIAGTKGKGSTAAAIGAMAAANGYRVGLFTSPHLDRIEERIVINGLPCSAADLTQLVEQIRPVVEQLDTELADRATRSNATPSRGPTYFELTTALALLFFAQQDVDLAVLEVGMGGRLDATNVCQPICSVITSISLDHTRQLGTSHAEIAAEKAEIIKERVPVVSGVTDERARQVIQRLADERQAPVVQLGTDFDFRYHPPTRSSSAAFDFVDHTYSIDARGRLPLNLIGRHQAANAAVAVAAIDTLRQSGWRFDETNIRAGLAEVQCRARIEILGREPLIVVDAAHNVASVAALVEVLDELPSPRPRSLIFATTLEKDARGMLKLLLPQFQHVVFTRYLNNPRSVEPRVLWDLANAIDTETSAGDLLNRDVCEDPLEAWNIVRRRMAVEGTVCVTGSFFIAAELRQLILRERPRNWSDDRTEIASS